MSELVGGACGRVSAGGRPTKRDSVRRGSQDESKMILVCCTDAARCHLGSAAVLYKCGSVPCDVNHDAVQMWLGVAWGRLRCCTDAARCHLGSVMALYKCGSVSLRVGYGAVQMQLGSELLAWWILVVSDGF